MKLVALLCNGLALVAALPVGWLLWVLGAVVRGSHVQSDRFFGLVLWALIPVFMVLPGVGLWLSTRGAGGWFWLGLGLGVVSLVFYMFCLIALPQGIEAAARP